jgi:hypothetical protein
MSKLSAPPETGTPIVGSRSLKDFFVGEEPSEARLIMNRKRL